MSVKVTSRVWETSQQSGAALLLLLALADFSDDEGYSFPEIPALADKARVTDRGAKGIIAHLERSGEIAVNRGAGRGIRSVYRVLSGLEPADIASTDFGVFKNARVKAPKKVKDGHALDPEKVNAEHPLPPERVNPDHLSRLEKVKLTTGKGEDDCIALRKNRQLTVINDDASDRSDSDAPKRAHIHVAADAATDAPASRSKPKRAEASEPGPDRGPTEQQRYFEAVATACGFDLALMADTDRTNVGKLVGKLRADPDVNLALIADAAARWALRFPGKRPADVAPPSVAQLTTWIGRCKLQRAGRRGLQHGAGSSIPSGWTFTGPDGRPRLKGFAVLQVEGHVPREADPLDPETWPPAYAAARAAMEGAA